MAVNTGGKHNMMFARGQRRKPSSMEVNSAYCGLYMFKSLLSCLFRVHWILFSISSFIFYQLQQISSILRLKSLFQITFYLVFMFSIFLSLFCIIFSIIFSIILFSIAVQQYFIPYYFLRNILLNTVYFIQYYLTNTPSLINLSQ